MFKSFTWLKFAADLGIVAGIVTSPLIAGFIPAAVAAYVIGGAAILRAVSSLITTTAAGKATVDSGPAVNSK